MMPRATLDFETRSECDLRKFGSWRYSLDPTTQVLCLAYHVPGWDEDRIGLWYPDIPALGIGETELDEDLMDLLDWVSTGGLVEAHNSWFERGIWNNVLVPRYGFPAIQHRQWRCSAAKAAALALPRGLGDAVAALQLDVQKDAEGHKLMKKVSKPRKALKQETAEWANDHGTGKCTQCKGKGTYKRKPCGKCNGAGVLGDDEAPAIPTLWHETAEQLVDLWEYCKTDVRAEKGLSESIPDLNPAETELYLLDQKINERGFQLDVDAVAAALTLIAEETADLNAQLAKATGGEVTKATQRERMKTWFASRGLVLTDTQGATIDTALETATDPEIITALTIVRELGRSSTAKYQAMQRWACADGRVRGSLLYHGATTGRWCLTGDHEVLTPDGWMRIDEWGSGAIACWDADASTFAFRSATQVSFPYNGDLVLHKSKRVDQLATPEHTLPAVVNGGVVAKPVDNFSGRIAWLGCRTVAEPRDALQTRILVMTQADGHFTVKGSLHFRFKKARKVERCANLLDAAGISYRGVERPDGAFEFRVYAKNLPDWLSQFREKTFAWDFLNVDANVFFEELEQWDGYRAGPESVQYSTTNRQNVDVVQALAHLSGRAVSVTVRRQEAHHSPCYSVSIWLTPGTIHRLGPPTTEAFSGSVYCAETATGFFLVRRNGKVWVTGNSGAGPQPHNFVRGTIKDQVKLWEVLKTGDRAKIRAEYGSVMLALANALRGAICAAPGKQLYVADYASIEARVLLWLAGDEKHLDLFRTGADIYCDMAASIYHRPVNKKDNPDERQLGKVAILGLGYQMGWKRFVEAALLMGGITIDKDMAQQTVDAYRDKYWMVVAMWGDQERAAQDAVSTWQPQPCGPVTWSRDRRFLFCTLPSGRRLAYPYPELQSKQTSWGEWRIMLTFEGVDPYTRQWKRQSTYGGMVVENLVQAIARDFMAYAMLGCEDSGIYAPVLSVHDELLAEADADKGDVKDFERILTTLPDWGAGCPIAAEGFRTTRYRK